jgi:hypothetical protein
MLRPRLSWTFLGICTLFTLLLGCGGSDGTPPPILGTDGGPDAGEGSGGTGGGGSGGAGQGGSGTGGDAGTPSCDPNPCPQEKPLCAIENGTTVCHCGAGTHDENGTCVPDVTCMPTTCSGHGTCAAGNGTVSCACQPGWAPPFCGTCDDMQGYHPDGEGGCTTDPCKPNPCAEPHKGTCTVPADVPVCACDPGYHDEGGACVVDQVCAPDSCHGHGTCNDAGGIVTCACDSGYMGVSCDACDAAAGYHPDGQGGCTQDPCTPNPCADPHKTACTPHGPLATCGCDAGWHDDGQGGCTQDPCTPNPCLATNQACKVDANGQAFCYTPACDDGNPCTTDSVMAGACQHVVLPDGSACSTTLCLSGQTCQGGACGGGTTVSCDDGNPCTKDACSDAAGCAHTADDALVPDDGVACTVDKCTAGTPSHTPSDAACNDGLWCTGVETCSPGSPAANGNGCVTTNVPSPPAVSGPCMTVGACDEATKSYPVVPKPVGASCDDAIACTTGDKCQAGGACAGTPTAACGTIDCATTTSLGSTIDIPVVSIGGTVTMGGQPLPATNGYTTGTTLYLKAKDTSALHQLAYFSYSGVSNGLYGPTFTARLVPGVYDLVYRRNWDSTYNTVSSTDAIDKLPGGMRILQSGVVIGAGGGTVNVDIPVATISGSITMGGQPLPATNGYTTGTTLYLKAKDTGALHQLAYFSYSGVSNGLYGPTFTARLVPGTYDLVYRRNWDSTYNTVSSTDAIDKLPGGMRVLQTDVVIAAGSNTVNIDIPVSSISGTVTMGGQPLPATNGYTTGTTLYLKAKDTGALHQLAYFSYSGVGNGLYGPTFTARLVPGTYDLIYRRNWDSTYNTVSSTDAIDKLPGGMRVLATDVMIAPGSSTVNVDIPVSSISGTVTMGGQPLPATNGYTTGTTLYLKAKDTGAMHQLAYFSYSGVGNGLYGPTFTARLVPGTYDLVYRRNWDSTYNTVSSTDAIDKLPGGMRVLASNIQITAGASTVSIDIPVTPMGGSITLGGQALPSTNGYTTGTTLYLKARDTGALHQLAYFSYSGVGNGLYGPTFTARLVPGTYDLVYRRNWDSTYNTVSSTDAIDKLPGGMRLLGTCFTVP